MSAPAPAVLSTSSAQVDRRTPLGATVGAGGVCFRVYAPAATAVFVLTGDALAAAHLPGFLPPPTSALTSLGDNTWAAFLPGAGEGTHYRFWVNGKGSSGFKRDPRARELTQSFPDSDCVVRAADTYPWHDQAFETPAFNDLTLYQLHIGVYYAKDANGKDKRASVAKFLDLLDRVDYLRGLNINGVQLMPIEEFPSEFSLGYNGVDLFSPEINYQVPEADLPRYLAKANVLLAAHGKAPITLAQLRPAPNQLKTVIDIFHLNGMAVLFDVVYNHAGGDFGDQSLYFFDRQPTGNNNHSLYFTDQGWAGGLIFAYWNQDVRQFLIDHALSCLDEYHVDGLRYDEVTVIDGNGGRQFATDLMGTLHFVHPSKIQIAEYWGDDRSAPVRPAPSGMGFDSAWGDRLREGVRGAIRQAAGGRDSFVDMAALAGSLDTPSGFPNAWRVVNCLENHDIVYIDRDQRVAQLAGGTDAHSWFGRSRARFATGLLAVARGIPMLFMGEEFLETRQWDDNTGQRQDLLVNWDEAESDPVKRDFTQFVRDLLKLRQALPALRGENLRVSRAESLDRVIAVHRWLDGAGQDVLVVGNLQEFNRFGYRVGFPAAGAWREVFNSDFYDGLPNPGTAGNTGGVNAEVREWDGFAASAEITIPANGFVIFTR